MDIMDNESLVRSTFLYSGGTKKVGRVHLYITLILMVMSFPAIGNWNTFVG